MNKIGAKGHFTSYALTLQEAYDECCNLVGPFVGANHTIRVTQTGSRHNILMRASNGKTVADEWETDFEWEVTHKVAEAG